MSSILLPIIPGTLPPGVCYSNEQARLNDFAAHMQAQLAGGMAFYNYGTSKPAPEFNTYPWLKSDEMRWYTWAGQWQAAHPYQSSTSQGIRFAWFGSVASLALFDGGDNNPPSTISGPMWTEDTTLQGRVPIGYNVIPGSDPVVTLNPQDLTGSGSHAQLLAEMAPHTHSPDPTQADSFWGHAVVGSAATGNVLGGGDSIRMNQTGVAGGNGATPNVATPMSLVQPSFAVVWAKRSIRDFYVVP